MEKLGYTILWFFFFIIFVDLLLLFFWAITFLKNRTPFIPVSMKFLPDIEKVLDIKEGDIIYDLGSGDGRILYFLSPKYKKSHFVGIENNPFALLMSKINSFFISKNNKENIKIIKNDFFKEDFSNATHIISYLHPFTMDDILPQFDKNLKKGTKFISINYRFTNLRPLYEIDLGAKKFHFTKRLYVYEF